MMKNPRPVLGSIQRTTDDIVYEETDRLIEIDSEEPKDYKLLSLPSNCVTGLSKNAVSIILAIFTLLGHLLLSLILPIWSSNFDRIGSDVFAAQITTTVWNAAIMFPIFLVVRVFYKDLHLKPQASLKTLFIYGMSNSLTGVFIVFASLPNRTPPYLQAILGSSLIPFTVLIRYVWLKKGVSLRRAVCIVIAMIGLFITMEPRIWGLPGSTGTGKSEGTFTISTAARILWPLSFFFGFVPDAVNRVVTEQELKKSNAQTLNFLAYGELTSVVAVLLVFWVDLIPGFGMAKSFPELWNHFAVGMRCGVSSDASCHHLYVKVWIMISAHVLGYVFHFLLIKYAEGAILASLVQSMRTPIASMFWTLYHYDSHADELYWSPEFNITTCFLIGGLLIVVPAMLLYNYFSNEEITRVLNKEREIVVPKATTVHGLI